MPRQAKVHEQIVGVLRARIEGGELGPGKALGSESMLAEEFAASRGTVRAALASLEELGLIDSVPAKGRFVRDPSAGVTVTPAAQVREVAARLREEIADGQPSPGSPFLSEKDVRERFGVSRYAARAALGELEAAGLIVARHGRGRFVAEHNL